MCYNIIMEVRHGKLTWVDIVKPSQDDLNWLRHKYRIHPVIIEELRGSSSRARVEAYDGYLFLIYHFPVYDPIEKVSKRSEVDFLITKKEVITIHYEELEAIQGFRKELAKPHFESRAFESSLLLMYELIVTLIGFNERQLRHIQEKIEGISGKLFKDKEREVLEEISYVKRDLSEYRVIVHPQEELLRSLLENGVKFWGEEARAYLNDLVGDYLKLANHLEAYREAVSDFEDTNNQIMNVKTNDIMKTFTILAFLTFPMMLFATLFGMNVQDTPLVDHPHGFWIILGVMVVAIGGMYLYFKQKDWI